MCYSWSFLIIPLFKLCATRSALLGRHFPGKRTVKRVNSFQDNTYMAYQTGFNVAIFSVE